MHEFNIFFLCAYTYFCCSDSFHLPTYASAHCHLCILAYPCFPTVPAHHVHLPLTVVLDYMWQILGNVLVAYCVLCAEDQVS